MAKVRLSASQLASVLPRIVALAEEVLTDLPGGFTAEEVARIGEKAIAIFSKPADRPGRKAKGSMDAE